MKIGILYICTGKYDIFWEKFYLSCEKYFLTKDEKHYFVFTDSKIIFKNKKKTNIHIIHQENLGWPNNTLMRFHIFLKSKNKLQNMDYLFFFNANLEIQKVIGNEILPKNEGLLVCQHPGFYNKSNKEFTYERNEKSRAYIKKGNGKVYIAGGFNGGKTKYFLNMCKKLNKNIEIDNYNNIVAKWHDESHINNYILYNNYKLIDPSYLYPEGWHMPFNCKILIRDKSKWINIYNIKGKSGKNKILNIFILIYKKIIGLFKK